MIRLARFLIFVLVAAPLAARAELELSFYSGQQTGSPSDISIRGDSTIPDDDFSQSWEGRSLEWPIYAGFRITRWQSETFGWGLDYAHNKVEPLNGELPAGFSALEFTDGLNTWTINAYRRWPETFGGGTPYIGGGVGLSVPGVEITYLGEQTFNYQITGPAATWLAGVSYPVSADWDVFVEYKGTYTQNEVDLDGGGTLETDIVTSAVNLGVSFDF